MKTTAFLLALGGLLGTAQAQTSPARPAPAKQPAQAAHQAVVAQGKSIGRKFVEKSKPYDAPPTRPVPTKLPKQ